VTEQQVAREAFYSALLDDDPAELYERAPCGYLSMRPDGTIVKVNQTFLTWTGYRREDLLAGRRFADLLSAGGRIYHETHFGPLLQMQGQVREIALEVVGPDGRRLPVVVNAALERAPDGSPRVIRAALFDATERREYERELVRAKERAEASEQRARQLARTLQQTLLPPSPPHIPGLDFAAAFRPAGEGAEVGGDFYDAFPVAEGDWVVVLGDVSGKGVDAAILTALVRHTLRAVVVGLREPSRALHVLNEVLLDYETTRFCTVSLVRLQRTATGWLATLASGGHPAPLLVRSQSPVEPYGAEGPLIGVLEGPEFLDRQLAIGPGDSLVLFTDGVTDGRRGREFYGDERLLACVDAHRQSPETIVSALLEDVLAFQRGTASDDVAIVAVGVPAHDD
jgi:sigma-B regulation protein RsbU (phosphoserine phosphatase)